MSNKELKSQFFKIVDQLYKTGMTHTGLVSLLEDATDKAEESEINEQMERYERNVKKTLTPPMKSV